MAVGVGPDRHGWRALVDTLEQVPVLRDPGGRRLCLDLLDDHLGFALQVPESNATRLHLFHILVACKRQHPRALGMLAKVLNDVEPGSPAVRRACQALDDMSALDLVPERARDELLGLISGMAEDRLVDFVHAAVGPVAAELAIDHQRPEEALAFLEQVNARPDGVPPLLVFVEYLARHLGDQRCEQLREWNDRQANRIGIAEKMRALRLEHAEPVPRGGDLMAYLVIRMERDLLDADRYTLTHWRQVDLGGWHPLRGDSFAGDMDEIRRHVAELIADAETGWAQDAANVRVEFLLPFELLNLPVDQWDLESGSGLPRPMGLSYQVVVRSLDRARAPRWHREWRRRWTLLKEMRPGAEMTDHWLWSEAAKPRQLTGLEARLAIERDVLSLVLRTRPADSELSEVLVGLRTGIPVMVWSRADGPRSAFEAAVREMQADLGALPEQARRLRSRASQSARPRSHVGNRVTVLWDDPERTVEPLDPPEAPQEEGTAS
ncbi:hypothetical protein [Amycolatopsis sp. NPDC059657]|uniref:VMAP-C domain-containing protein n=1 Tax=Amycolatopsis sp. NPDC059657 TaxID=3346899 RepID=UPI003670D92B